MDHYRRSAAYIAPADFVEKFAVQNAGTKNSDRTHIVYPLIFPTVFTTFPCFAVSSCSNFSMCWTSSRINYWRFNVRVYIFNYDTEHEMTFTYNSRFRKTACPVDPAEITSGRRTRHASVRSRPTTLRRSTRRRRRRRCSSLACTGTPGTWRSRGRPSPRGSNRPGWRRSDRNSRAPTADRWARSRTTPTGWTDSGTRAACADRGRRTSRTRRRPTAGPGSTPARRSCASGTAPSGRRLPPGPRPRPPTAPAARDWAPYGGRPRGLELQGGSFSKFVLSVSVFVFPRLLVALPTRSPPFYVRFCLAFLSTRAIPVAVLRFWRPLFSSSSKNGGGKK